MGLGNIQYSYNRYLSWVNPETGPTGKERSIWGVEKPGNIDAKLKKIDKVINLKAYPELSEKAVGFRKVVEEFYPLVTEANQYYTRQDYKDDDMKKGKELHVKLMQGFDEYFAKRGELEAALGVIQDKVMAEGLAKAKAAGRHIEFEVKTVLMIGDKIWKMSSVQDLKNVPLDDVKQELEKLMASQEKLKTLAEGLEDYDKRTIMNYYERIDILVASTKKFIRVIRDDEHPRKQEAELKGLLASYNAMVGSYNGVISSAAISK